VLGIPMKFAPKFWSPANTVPQIHARFSVPLRAVTNQRVSPPRHNGRHSLRYACRTFKNNVALRISSAFSVVVASSSSRRRQDLEKIGFGRLLAP